VAVMTDGEDVVLLLDAEIEVFRWLLVVAEARVAGVLVVVDLMQRDPLLAAIKTLPADVCFLESSTDLGFPSELLDRVD